MTVKKRCIFYYSSAKNSFRYEGYILETTDSHIVIKEIRSGKTFHLPKSETVIEEVDG